MRKVLATSLIALTALVFAGCGRDDASAQPKRPPRLERERPMPDLARKLLRDRMSDHRTRMSELLSAALVLDHATTESIATDLAQTPALPRQIDTELGPIKPEIVEQFFAYQQQMRRAADELAKAARDRDNKGVPKAYGRLTEACVGCHAAYLDAEVVAGSRSR